MPRVALRRFATILAASLTVLAAPLAAMPANATTLSGTLTVDNAFNAYLSTSASSLGTLLTSGANWGQSFSFSNVALTAGETYYLNIEAANIDGPAGFIGSFGLSGSGFHFANGRQKLNTGVAHWTGGFNAATSNLPQSWTSAAGSVVALGSNGSAPWYSRSGIASTAQWIWPSDSQSSPGTPTNNGGECTNCTVDFQATILADKAAPAPVPEPASIAVFATALAGLAFTLRRRRRLA